MEEIQELVYEDINNASKTAVVESEDSEGSTLVVSRDGTPAHTTTTTGVENIISSTLGKKVKINETIVKDWSRPFSKKEKTLYLTLLMCLSIFFIIVRSFEYAYNRLRLKLSSIINTHANSPHIIKQDAKYLNKVPKRLATILNQKSISEINGGVKGLLNDASELVCWTTASGIPQLIIYDHNGILKANVSELKKTISLKLTEYYGVDKTPSFAIRIPHSNKLYYSDDKDKKVSIEIFLLSSIDGKQTITDLTITMHTLYKQKEITMSAITQELVESELYQLVGPEPDLLLIFGPNLDFQDYPPWHLRLTEFYWQKDNTQVNYSIFRDGLRKFAGCKMNVGK